MQDGQIYVNFLVIYFDAQILCMVYIDLCDVKFF